MALEISYSPLFFENLEAILKFFDERNGSDLIIDIYACQTNPEERMFKKQ